MAKVDTSALTQHLVGRVGDIVYRKVRGKLQAALRPITVRRAPPSPQQQAQQAKFGKGCGYANKILANPESRAEFERLALAKNITARNLAISDYFRMPEVQSVEVREYQGRIGDKITVSLDDNTSVVRKVTITVRLVDGTVVEEGAAVLLFNEWVYSATGTAPAGSNAIIEAKAEDWAKREALKSVNLAL